MTNKSAPELWKKTLYHLWCVSSRGWGSRAEGTLEHVQLDFFFCRWGPGSTVHVYTVLKRTGLWRPPNQHIRIKTSRKLQTANISQRKSLRTGFWTYGFVCFAEDM